MNDRRLSSFLAFLALAPIPLACRISAQASEWKPQEADSRSEAERRRDGARRRAEAEQGAPPDVATQSRTQGDARPPREPLRMDPQRLVAWLEQDRFNPSRMVEALPPADFTGSLTAWAEDGTRYCVSEFQNGQKHGEERFYYPDGALFRRWTFQNGDAEGPCVEWYASGVRTLEVTFRDGLQDGDMSFYEEDGLLSSNGPMRRGKKHGLWSNYLPGKGYPFAQEMYADGAVVSQRVLEEPTLQQLRRVQESVARKKTHSHKALWDRYLAAARAAPDNALGRLVCTAAWRQADTTDIQLCFEELDTDDDHVLGPEELRAGGVQGFEGSSADIRWTTAELSTWCQKKLGVPIAAASSSRR